MIISHIYSEHCTGFQSNTILNIGSSFYVSRQYMDLHQAIPLIYYSYTDQFDHCDQTHLTSWKYQEPDAKLLGIVH